MRHYFGACGWGTARLGVDINCVQYGPAGGLRLRLALAALHPGRHANAPVIAMNNNERHLPVMQ